MEWKKLDRNGRKAIVARGEDRAEELMGRWIPGLRPYAPALRVLFAPKLDEMLADGAPSGLDWWGAIKALKGTPVAKTAGIAGGATIGLAGLFLALRRKQ